MPNMSYVRFENTLPDLRDCYDALCDEKELSEREAKCAKKLVKLCKAIAEDFPELLEEDD